MSKYALVAVSAFLAWNAAAYDIKKCFSFQTKRAMFRKYDLKYLAPSTHPSDSVNCSIPTDTTSKEGITKYSSQNTTQGSTMSLDPGVSTNGVTGSTQFTSSFGECAMFGYRSAGRRDAFIASNWDSLREEIALGDGDHLAALADLSGCSPDIYDVYVDGLRVRYARLASPMALATELDGMLRDDPKLRSGCVRPTVALAEVLVGRPS
jgi:hypothetical protein